MVARGRSRVLIMTERAQRFWTLGYSVVGTQVGIFQVLGFRPVEAQAGLHCALIFVGPMLGRVLFNDSPGLFSRLFSSRG